MLRNLLPNLNPPISGNNNLDCPQCDSRGFIYTKRPIYIGNRFYGELEEMVDCPTCKRVIHAHCEACDDSGYIRYNVPLDDPRFGQLFPCNCPKGRELAERQVNNLLKNAQIPDFYKKLNFQSWQALPASAKVGKELAFAACVLYSRASNDNFQISRKAFYKQAKQDMDGADRNANSLVLEGAKGIGKTGLGVSVCNYLAQSTAVRPLYIRCRDLIRNVQDSYKKDSTADPLSEFMNAPLLMVDEMNLTQTTPDRQDIMEEIIRHRHNNTLPTIITLNVSRAEFELEWGSRTATVAYAMSHWIAMTGASIRDEGIAE